MIYSGRGYKDWEIGDVEVILHDGVYHLFHLIIPNHDYIAHAVSVDGINWKRVKNAIFVGDPGTWDDDMIWTMDVSPFAEGFVMYYTGLSMKDEGITQRVGRAFSEDLYHWYKDENSGAILESEAPHYENLDNNPRSWLSFRDPYRYLDEAGNDYLLICARAAEGATHHRGCVALAKLVEDQYELQSPLLYPGLYDDVECPCIIKIKDYYYMIGSIREDIKVRYWFSKNFFGPYKSFHADMLMPGGNYAARLVDDGEHTLIYGFYFSNKDLNHKRVLPPPKEIDTDEKGRLFLKSYYRWEEKIQKTIEQDSFPLPHPRLVNANSITDIQLDKWTLISESGYQVYSFKKPSYNFIWEGTMTLEGLGKCGLVLNEDGQGNGYFISIDFVNGYTKIRTWGFNPLDVYNDFIFNKLQSNLFQANNERSHRFRLIYYGNYIEFSIDGKVKLTLVDESFKDGNVGFYLASATVALKDSKIHVLEDVQSTYTDSLMGA